MTEANGFNAAVLAWLRTRPLRAHPMRIIEVRADGSDWGGDTDHGFYATFQVTIIYEDNQGQTYFEYVEGGALESLWKAVVR